MSRLPTKGREVESMAELWAKFALCDAYFWMTKQIFETNLWELSLLMLIRTLPIQEGGKGGIVGQMDWREANELVTL